MTIVDTLLFGVQGLVGFLFLGSGGTKLVAVEDQVAEFDRYGFPQWFRVVTGIIEIGGRLRLLIGITLTLMYAILGGPVLGG